MRIIRLIETKSKALYKIDEYTTPLGEIIFDGSKGGNVSNTYFFRFNKNVGERIFSGNTSHQASSCIDFYMHEKTHQFQLIEFVTLQLFDQSIDEHLVFEKEDQFYDPIIDISTWVSPFGNHKNFSYDSEDKRYLYTEDQINVQIVHNSENIVQFVFGELSRSVGLNEQISIYLDDLMNLSGIIICDDVEVPKLIRQLS